MSENKAIEYLTEFRLSWKDLSILPDDQKASLAIFSFAVSEVNALMKMFLLSNHSSIGEPAIDQMASIQRNTILRVWSAKVFEFSVFLTYGGKKKTTSDPDLLQLATESLAKFDALKTGQGFAFAQNIRHESTNHYSFSAAKGNIKHMSSGTNCDIFMHEKTGNSFYPMGESVMFMGRFSRHNRPSEYDNDLNVVVEAWLDWLIKATSWMQEVFDSFFELLKIRHFPDRFATERMYWIDPIFVGNADERKMPIFLRTNSK